jgi:hypothetical protein
MTFGHVYNKNKNKQTKKTWARLPSKHKALSSNPSTTKHSNNKPNWQSLSARHRARHSACIRPDGPCVSQTSIAVTNNWENIFKGRFIFAYGFRDFSPEISAHGQLALLFLGHGLAEYQGGKHVLEQSSLFHGRQEAERRGRSQKQGVLQRHAPLTYFLWPGPTFHSSTIFQESVQILTPSMA